MLHLYMGYNKREKLLISAFPPKLAFGHCVQATCMIFTQFPGGSLG